MPGRARRTRGDPFGPLRRRSGRTPGRVRGSGGRGTDRLGRPRRSIASRIGNVSRRNTPGRAAGQRDRSQGQQEHRQHDEPPGQIPPRGNSGVDEDSSSSPAVLEQVGAVQRILDGRNAKSQNRYMPVYGFEHRLRRAVADQGIRQPSQADRRPDQRGLRDEPAARRGPARSRNPRPRTPRRRRTRGPTRPGARPARPPSAGRRPPSATHAARVIVDREGRIQGIGLDLAGVVDHVVREREQHQRDQGRPARQDAARQPRKTNIAADPGRQRQERRT